MCLFREEFAHCLRFLHKYYNFSIREEQFSHVLENPTGLVFQSGRTGLQTDDWSRVEAHNLCWCLGFTLH